MRFSDLVNKLCDIDFTFSIDALINGNNLENIDFIYLNVLIVYAKYAVYFTSIDTENSEIWLSPNTHVTLLTSRHHFLRVFVDLTP